MGNLCIIPARGGSKRIPGKNIKDFLGKPIITYSIEAALSSGCFDEVMVSTDDERIEAVSLEHEAKVPFVRSDSNSDDYASTIDVLLEVLDSYENEFDKTFEYVCCIYPTSPLIQVSDIQKGFNLLCDRDLDGVFPVVAFSYPVLRGLKRNKDGITSFAWPEHQKSRSQDLEPMYHDAGQWYWVNSAVIKKSEMLIGANSGSIVLSEMNVQDIDTPSDWEMAEIKYRILNEG